MLTVRQATYTKIFLQFNETFWFPTEVGVFGAQEMLSYLFFVRWGCTQTSKEADTQSGKAWITSVSSQVLASSS
jgi:hypothetical protein